MSVRSRLHDRGQICENKHLDVEGNAAGMAEVRDELSHRISMRAKSKPMKSSRADQVFEHESPR